MQHINEFSKGLHQSNSPISQPEGSYPDATNWIRNDEGRLTNEELEEIITSLPKDLKGYTILNGEVICLFENEIGIFANNIYTKIVDTPFSDITDAVEAKARVGLYNHRLLYFVEKDKYIRRINLDEPSKYTTIDDYQLQLDFQLPEISNVTVNSSGNLPTGVYYITARYMTAGGNKTATGLISGPISIVDGFRNNNSDNYDGAFPGSASGKSITFNVSNNDTTYPFVEILIATYENITNVLTSYSIGTYNNNSQPITFSDINQYVDRVNLSELTTNPTFYEGAGSIEQKDNVLVLSNLSSKVIDLDLLETVDRIEVIVVPKHIPITTNITGLPSPQDEDSNFTATVIDTGINNNIGSPKDELYIKDFQRGETYSFSVTPIYKNGSLGFAYPLRAKANGETRGSYLTTYRSPNSQGNVYPDNYGYWANTPVYNHLMPDVDTIPLYDNVGNVIQLTLQFTPIDFSAFPDIVGYVIGYQKRDSSLNTSILTEGIARPFLLNGTNRWVGPLTGSLEVDDNGGNIAEASNIADCSFLSPDIIHGQEIEGTKFEYLGIQKIKSKTIAREGDADKSQVVEFIYNNVDANFVYKGRKRNITDEIDIPNLPFDTRSYGYTSDNKAFNVRGTKGYKHISTDTTFFDSADFTASNGDKQYVRQINDNADKWKSLETTGGRSISDTHFNVFTGRLLNDFSISQNQYGRVENAEYSQLGYSLDKSVTSLTLGGDTYTQRFAFDVCEGVHDDLDNNASGTVGYTVIRGIIYVFLQSKNNFCYKHYNTDEVPYYPKFKTLYSTTEPLGLGNIDHTKGYSTGYNRQYSAVNDLRRTIPKPSLFAEVNTFPNRSIYSEQAFEGELEDSYRTFLPNNFHDIPKNKGEITDTFVYNNTFYHQTERALFKSFFNPNTTQATSEGEVILGSSGIFRLPSVDVFTQDGGYVGTTTKAGYNTPFGRIILDNHQGKVFLLNEGMNEISDLGLFSFFRNFLNPDDKYTSTYDFKNKRYLLANTTQNKAISYYPKTNTWTSFHTFSPKYYISIDKNTLAWKDLSFHNLENSSNLRKDSTITIVANNEPDIYKRFENLEINSMSGGNNSTIKPGSILEDNYYFKKNTFTDIQCWNEVQNSTQLPIKIVTDFQSAMGYSDSQVLAQYSKGDFNIELPLDAVIDANDNIFDPSNLDTSQLFKIPFNSKFLYIKLSYNNTLPLVVSYIKTNSKVSDY